MNGYEQLKNQFLVELEKAMHTLSTDDINTVSGALDRAAYQFDVKKKETGLSVYVDPIPGAVKVYLIVKKTEGLSDGTLKNYARVLKSFFLWSRKPVEEVTANDIRMYLYEYKRARPISDRTLDKYREIICWFFGWAREEEYIARDPSKAVKAIKHETKERQSLTQVELEYMRMACQSPRERAILEFAYSTGCRVSEMAGVKLSDIDWGNSSVHLFGKGKKHRTSFINAKAEVALREYISTRNDNVEYLFVSERKPHAPLKKNMLEAIIREVGHRSNVRKRVTPHILRHTCATQAVNSGMPIEDVSKLLGHSSVNTTMIYAKVSTAKVKSEHLRCLI